MLNPSSKSNRTKSTSYGDAAVRMLATAVHAACCRACSEKAAEKHNSICSQSKSHGYVHNRVVQQHVRATTRTFTPILPPPPHPPRPPCPPRPTPSPARPTRSPTRPRCCCPGLTSPWEASTSSAWTTARSCDPSHPADCGALGVCSPPAPHRRIGKKAAYLYRLEG
eukprot:4197197-Pleurochrysis_carterae.AAC.1